MLLKTCLEALEVATRLKWLDVEAFDSKAYTELCAKWDATWVIPGEILLMADPMTTVMDPDPATCSHLVGPETPNFAAWFEVLNVAGLVRLNKDRESGLEKSYDAKKFKDAGLLHVQAAYDDTGGGVPDKAIAKKVLDGCSEVAEGKAIAFHCKAGFGRSGVCAALLAIHRYDLSGQHLLAWLRFCRPGTITTLSQARFLASLQGRQKLEEWMSESEGCCTMC